MTTTTFKDGILSIVTDTGGVIQQTHHPETNEPITEANWQAVADLIYPCTYSQKRAAEYPPMQDYLDGLVKGDQAQIDKYIVDCLAVKAKYPKP